MPARLLPLLLLSTLAAFAWPQRGEAQIRRCTNASGQAIFTDRSCDDVGAVDGLGRTASTSPVVGGKPYARGCSRNVRDLVQELSASIDSRDVNRLAGLYNWTGMSSRGSTSVLGRLQAIAERPLVDISPVLAAPSVRMSADGSVQANGGADVSIGEGDDVDLYPQVASGRTPVALRVDQTYGRSASPSRTVFGLRRYMGCWWVTL